MKSHLQFLFLLAAFSAALPNAANAQQTSQLPNILSAQPQISNGTSVMLAGTITIGTTIGSISISSSPNGQSQINLTLPAGSETETRLISRLLRYGTWTDLAGAQHQVPQQDLVGPHPAWCFPPFILISGLASPQYLSADLGPETRNGASVEHIAFWQNPLTSVPASVQPNIRPQSQYDVYFDPSTLLPVAMTFPRYFDSNSATQFLAPAPTSSGSMVEEVRYSNYQQVQGVSIPFQLQILFQGTTFAVIQFSSASLTPVTASAEKR